jgi:hypothetical protein
VYRDVKQVWRLSVSLFARGYVYSSSSWCESFSCVVAVNVVRSTRKTLDLILYVSVDILQAARVFFRHDLQLTQVLVCFANNVSEVISRFLILV